MKKFRMYQAIIILIVCCVSLVGCSRTRIIDKISIVHIFGFDLNEKGELVGTALSPEYTKSKSSDEIQYLEEQNNNSTLLVSEMATKSSTPVEIAKIRVLLFGKKFAEAGIQDMVKRFIMTPELGTNIQIAVTTHSARETLKKFMKQKSLTLADQIEQNMRDEFIPSMNLHVFLNHFYGEGMDAYVLLLTIDDNERINIEGVGIFKDEKLKLLLDIDQTAVFSLLEDEQTQAPYKITLDENNRNEMITVRSFFSKSKWDWNKNKKELNLRLELQMTLTQYPDRFDIRNEKEFRNLKTIIVENLQKEIEALLELFKEEEVDPLGIGNIVRSKDKNWNEESFYQLYPTLPIHVNIDLKIIHSGLES